jgi:uncharacterized protein YydD (DUF2326 family)
MIRRIYSDLPKFKTVTLEPGFNMVLADRTKDSTKKDTRNGLGKSTLLDIIHFCLGSSIKQGDRLYHPGLANVVFGLELELYGKRVTAERSRSSQNYIWVEGETDGLPLKPEVSAGRLRYAVADWNQLLGLTLFAAPVDSPRRYKPSFRSLISYLVRRGKDAYSEPFRHFAQQATWDIQVNNAFLLGLVWEDASDWQELRDRRKLLKDLREAAQTGLIEGVLGSRGELEAERLRLEHEARSAGEALKKFQVLPQYRQLESRANELSAASKVLANENVGDQNVLDFYRSSLLREHPSKPEEIAKIYQSANIELPGTVVKRLEDVERFHVEVVENRRRFLLAEISRLESAIADRNVKLAALAREHGEVMALLDTHGALDEYTKMQRAYSNNVVRLRELSNQLENLRRFEEGVNSLKIDAANLEKRARENYDARQAERSKAVSLFNDNSEALYNAPGKLIIDIGEAGLKFNVEIERKGSTGISNMEIFCYDLMLAQMWTSKSVAPKLLIHDSNIFADVDDRQVALALVRARDQADSLGFQYICTFNSDKLPLQELPADFGVDAYTRVRFTDATEDGGLLGMRLPRVKQQKATSKKG